MVFSYILFSTKLALPGCGRVQSINISCCLLPHNIETYMLGIFGFTDLLSISIFLLANFFGVALSNTRVQF